jgi:hypothetical protein
MVWWIARIRHFRKPRDGQRIGWRSNVRCDHSNGLRAVRGSPVWCHRCNMVSRNHQPSRHCIVWRLSCSAVLYDNRDIHRGTTLNIGTTAATTINIGNSGSNNLLGGGGSALATVATAGFPLLPTMAGMPTGTVGALGKAAVVIDTTDNKICWSTGGGTWKCAAGR